jgi:hypothetical protein
LMAWLRRTTAPMPWPEGAHKCPKCRRPLAGSIAPFGAKGGAPAGRFALSVREKIEQCPLDGSKYGHRDPTTRTPRELDSEAADMAAALVLVGEPIWAKMVQKGFTMQGLDRVLYLGHALAIVNNWHRLPAQEERLQQLVVDYVARWPE